MESILTTIIFAWAIGGLFVPFTLLGRYRPAMTMQARLLVALAIYIGGGTVLFVIASLLGFEV